MFLLIWLSLHPVVVKLRVEADNEIVSDPEGRGAQIAARPHHRLQDRLPSVAGRFEMLDPFPLDDGDRLRRLQQLPGRLRIDPLLARIGDLFRFDSFFPKKLLGIVAGRSALAQVGPIDVHAFLPG